MGHHQAVVQKTEIKGIKGIRNFWIMMSKAATMEVRKVTKIRNLYNQVLYLAQETTGESDKNTI